MLLQSDNIAIRSFMVLTPSWVGAGVRATSNEASLSFSPQTRPRWHHSVAWRAIRNKNQREESMRGIRRSSGNLGTIGAVAIAAAMAQASPAGAANFIDPPVFASVNGVLDIMMVAKAMPIAGLL